ncbi:MAG: sulfatase-like hydrolase/transferase [Candidatus Nanohalobium sp.]
MSEFENIFIFVSDSLRYDHVPDSIAEEGNVINTLAPSLHTPVSFASLITGKSPENHSVRGFNDTLSAHHRTIFDFFENGSFYDNELDPVRNTVLKHTPEAKELDEIEPPFVYIERAMDTHIPYGEMGHGNDLLAHQMEDGEVRGSENIHEKYEEGSKSVESHFWEHIEELEKRGLKQSTLIIFTSDHGELLGERKNFRRRFAHGHPMSRELVEVPTVFLNYDGIQEENARLIDLTETALNLMKGSSLKNDGINLVEKCPKAGRSVIDGYVSYDTAWRFENGSWEPTKGESDLKKTILREDLRMLLSKIGKGEIIEREGRYQSETDNIDF